MRACHPLPPRTAAAWVLFFHDEKVSVKGSLLAQVPLALATGICLTLRAFDPDIHEQPASGEPVITEIVRIGAEPKREQPQPPPAP